MGLNEALLILCGLTDSRRLLHVPLLFLMVHIIHLPCDQSRRQSVMILISNDLHILAEIVPFAHRAIYPRPDYYRAADPHYIMDVAKELRKDGDVHVPLSTEIERARDLADKKDLILITGSLFTVGEAKSYFDPIHYPREDI